MNKRQAKKKKKFINEVNKLGWLEPKTWSQIRWAKALLKENKE